MLLYQLLTGRSPYRLVNYSQLQLERTICMADPVRPSHRVVSKLSGENDGERSRIAELRGTSPQRLRAILGGDLDAIILACAGLIRLGWESRIAARLEPAECLPADSQGIIGIDSRTHDANTRLLLAVMNDAHTRTAMDAERAFAGRLGGSCQSPIAAHAVVQADRLTLQGLVAEPDGSRLLRDTITGAAADAALLGRQLADRVMAAGAGTLLERLRTG